MPEDKLKKFHDSIKNNPNIVGVPEDYNKFQTALKNPEKAQSFFKAISENKSIVGLPDNYNSFASSLGLVEKKNPNEKPLASSGTASSTESGKTNFVSPRDIPKARSQESVTRQVFGGKKALMEEAGIPKTLASLELLEKNGITPQPQFSDLGALNKEVVTKITENSKVAQAKNAQADAYDKLMDVILPGTKILPNSIRSSIISSVGGFYGAAGGLVDKASDVLFTEGSDVKKNIDKFVGKAYEAAEATNDISQGLMRKAKLSNGINPDIDTVTYFESGNIIDGVKSLFSDMGGQAANMAMQATGVGGIIASGVSSFGSAVSQEVKDDGELSGVDFLQSALQGSIDAVLAKFFNVDIIAQKGIIKGIGGFLTKGGSALAKEVAEKGAIATKEKLIRTVADVGRKAVGGMKDEVKEELLATSLGFAVDLIDKDEVKVEDFQKLYHDLKTSGLLAVTMGGGASTIAAGFSMKSLTKEQTIEIGRYESILSDENTSRVAKDLAKRKISQIKDGVGYEADQNLQKAQKLNLEDKVKVNDLKNKIEELEVDIDNSTAVQVKDDLLELKNVLVRELETILNSESGKVDDNQGASVQGSGTMPKKPTAFDFDGTLMDNATGKLTPLGEEVKERIANGEDISIVTARESNNIDEIKQSLGIEGGNIYATGNESLKGETLDALGIDRNNYFDADTQKLDNIRSGVVVDSTETAQTVKRTPLYDSLDSNNKRNVLESLSDAKKTESAIESAKQFQPQEVEALLKPEIGESASYTVSRKGKPVVFETEVVNIDLENGKATIKDKKGVDKEIALDKLFKTPKQVAEQYHRNLQNGTNEGLLNGVEGVVVKDVSDDVINKQRRMSAPIKGRPGIRSLVDKLPLPLKKFYNNVFSSGNRDAVRALETKDSFMAAKRDRLASVTKKLINLVNGNKNLRDLANTVISQGMVGDKIDSFTNKTTVEAISELTGIDKDIIEGAYKDTKDPKNIAILQEMNDKLAALTEEGTKAQINKIIQDEIIKDKTTVRTLGARWMNPDSKNNIDDEGNQLTRDDIEDKILKLKNGEAIIDALKKSKDETDAAKQTLSTTPKGKKLLDAATEARDMIDEFSSWVDDNIAGLKIKNKSIGDSIAENVGFYMKKTYDHWTDKDFSFDQKTQKDAVDSMIRSILPIRLGNLVNTKSFINASDKVKERLIKNLTDKTAKDAGMAFADYIAEVTSDKEFRTTTASTIASKVASKNLMEKDFMNEHFEKVLGKNADAIERLNATVVAQAQVQGAAEMGRILRDLAGDTFFNTREEGIQKMMDGGLSEMEAGVKFGKEYRQITDKYSVNDGQWIPVDLHEVIYEKVERMNIPLLYTLKAMTSVWRMAKTVFNPAGHVTNTMGGHISIAEQGHFVDDKTIKFLLDRFRLMGGANKISPEGQETKKLMIDTGIWGTSVNLADIELILKYTKADENSKAFDKGALIAVKKAFEKSGAGIKRYYSATDDFTKLILAEKKKDPFANKLYGKNWDKLSTKEKAITFANIAERIKQNMPTASRLPKFAKALINSVVVGDFQGFRFGAFTSFFNTLANATVDIMEGLNNKSLSKEQKKAYLEDGIKTLTASGAIFAVDKIYAAKMAAIAGVGMGLIAKGAKGVFDEEKDKEDSRKSIGSKFDFYENIKNSFFLPEWAMGQNLIVVSDDGKGKIKLMNMSNTFGNDESYKLFSGQNNLPIISLDKNKDTAVSTSLLDTFSINGMIQMFNYAIKGEDAWGKPINNRVTYLLKEMIPPSFKRVYDLSSKYAKDQVGEAKKDGSLDTREITAINMLKGMAVNAPEAIKRTYDLDFNSDVYYRAKDFFKDNSTRYKNLSKEDKVLRIRKLEPMRNSYLELKKYQQFTGNKINAEHIFDKALERRASKEEIKYIKKGIKPEEVRILLNEVQK